MEKSLNYLDEKKEKLQRDATVKMFIENIVRLEKYLFELKEDWKKVKIIDIPISDYVKKIEKQRIERLSRQ